MAEVIEVGQIIEGLKAIMGNVWLLTFAALWVVGWLLKEHTTLSNKLIPSILVLIGTILGFIIIEKTLAGAIMGCIMAYLIIAFYEHIKNTIEFIVMKKKPPSE